MLEISPSGRASPFLRAFDASQSSVTAGDFPLVDCEALPYASGVFDFVIMDQVLEHTRRPWRCVQEAHRVLGAGGVLIAASPSFYQTHGHPVKLARCGACERAPRTSRLFILTFPVVFSLCS